MHAKLFGWRSASALVGLGLFAGCIVVQPLEDYPTDSAGGGGSSGRGGSTVQPEAGEGGSSGGDAGKGGSATAGTGSGGCQTNADCKSAGTADEPYLCRQADHKCVRLREQVCPVAFADEISNPNSIVIGAFATLSPTNPERSPIVYAHQLAWEELSGDLVGGLPDGPKDTLRPLSLVICYNQEDKVDEGLTHLIEDLGVSGVIATLKPGDMLRAYDKYKDKDVFYLSPVSMTEPVVGLEDDGKVWNMLGQPNDLLPTYSELLPLVEQYARKLHSLEQSGDKVKVALVTTLDAFDIELSQKLKPALIFNGLSLDTNTLTGNYKVFTAQGTAAEDVAAVVDGLLTYQPDIIISAASEVMTMLDGVVKQTDADWSLGASPDAPSPIWVLSPFNSGDLGYLSQVIGTLAVETNEELMQNRFLGVSIAGPENGDANFDYQSRLGGRFGNIYKDTANYYDATYLLAYALYAAGIQEPLTGSSIVRGMKRLISGAPTAIGPDNILEVFDALAQPDATIELESALGPPSFNGETGARQVDGSVFCFKRNGTLAEPVMDSVRYDRTQKKLVETGKFCFTGFLQ